MAKGRNEAGPEVVAGHLLGAAPPAQQGEKGGPKVSPKGKGWSGCSAMMCGAKSCDYNLMSEATTHSVLLRGLTTTTVPLWVVGERGLSSS